MNFNLELAWLLALDKLSPNSCSYNVIITPHTFLSMQARENIFFSYTTLIYNVHTCVRVAYFVFSISTLDSILGLNLHLVWEAALYLLTTVLLRVLSL